jgi:hypothetical protein
MGEDEIRLPAEYVKETLTYSGQYWRKGTKVIEKIYCSKTLTCTHRKEICPTISIISTLVVGYTIHRS